MENFVRAQPETSGNWFGNDAAAVAADTAAVEQQMMQQAIQESLLSRWDKTPSLCMDLQNTATAMLDAPTSSAACSSRMTSDPDGSTADKIPESTVIGHAVAKDNTSCQSTTNCEAELSQQPTTFCNAFHHSGAHVDNCQNATFTISVELAPEGEKDVFEVHKTMNVGKFKESLRQDWDLGEEEELMLMVQKKAGTDALEDQLTFNDVMEDSALVKPSKTMTKAGHYLTFSLRHCMPVTLSVDLRAEQEQ